MAYGLLDPRLLGAPQRMQFGSATPQPVAAPAGGLGAALPQQGGGLGGLLGGFMDRMRSMRETNPEALMMIGAGMQQGNMGGGFEAAAHTLGPAREREEKLKQRNATREWLKRQGLSDADAEAAMSSPEILNSYLKKEATGEKPTSIQEYEYGIANPGFADHMRSNKGRDSALTTVDKKAIFEAEDELPALDGTLQALGRAKELNKDTYTGFGAGTRGWLGTVMPDPLGMVDDKKANATVEFNNLMSFESIKAMADTLKGATTDFELNKFVEILADPSTPPKIRERTIDRMMQLAERKKQIASDRINQLRNDQYFTPEGGQSGKGGEGWQELGNGVRIRPMGQ